MTEPTDEDRYPTLSEGGRRMLDWLREHPSAPVFRNRSGNRLREDDITALVLFDEEVTRAKPHRHDELEPAWCSDFMTEVFRHVPYYRAMGVPPRRFTDLPVVSRADFSADIARFVPDDIPLERIINFRTTGTTGHPLLIPSHPQVAGRYLSFHKRALFRHGIVPTHGSGQVGVVLLGHQQRCFTYISVTPTMGESGLVKLNLHPVDWRDPADRSTYLEALDAEFITGDPISFAELLRLPARLRPRALMSVSMALSTGLRKALEERYECPVLDLYSMNEVGPVAVYDAELGGHVLLQHRLFVEILDDAGHRLADGMRGEITVTGGFNFCLPLLRYRTGDFAALERRDGEIILRALAGRAPVRFRTASGAWVNNIDVTHAVDHLPLSHYALHQRADGSLHFLLGRRDARHEGPVGSALASLMGELTLTIELVDGDDKTVQYRSDVGEAHA